jgi:TolB-like protein
MKRKLSVRWAIHRALLSVLLAISILSCGSSPEVSQNPASVLVGKTAATAGDEGSETQSLKYTLAILPFAGGEDEDGETIAELFSFDPTINTVFTPIPRTSINRAIRREQNFQMDTSMTDPDSIIAIGKQLGAQYIVAGNITSLGRQHLLVISIIRIDRLQQVAGAIQTYIDIEEIQGKLPNMAETITSAIEIDTSKLPRLAVVPFLFRNSVNESDADVLAQILAINIMRSGTYAVYPRTATLEQVQTEYDNQLTGDTADKHIVSMGKGENPQFVLSSTARKLNTQNMFNASIINLESGIQEKGDTVSYRTLDDGMQAMRILTRKLTSEDMTVYNVTIAETLTEAIDGINEGIAERYTMTLRGNVAMGAMRFTGRAQKTITLQGDGSLRTISNSTDSPLLTIPDGITIVLGNNIKLDGNGKQSTLVYIEEGGTLRMETGATISGATNSGVMVSGGTFTMNGGTISDNTADYYDDDDGYGYERFPYYPFGGGVYVVEGTFTMSGGTISGNTATGSDGLVLGGGVYVGSGTFTMSGGTISGNTVIGLGGGGGVYVKYGTFTKTGGTIDGTNAAPTGSVVYVRGNKKRETAAGPDVKLDSRISGEDGGWE